MLRDDFAAEVLNTAVEAVLKAPKWIAEQLAACARETIDSHSTEGESPEKLEYEIRQITQKKEYILDAFFSRDITKEEMRQMNERYDRRLSELHTALCAAREREQLSYETGTLPSDIAAHIAFLDACDRDELFFRSLLNSMTVYPDRRMVIRLNLLPEKWRFVLDYLADMRLRTDDKGCYHNPSVPMSVSRPFSSSKGIL